MVLQVRDAIATALGALFYGVCALAAILAFTALPAPKEPSTSHPAFSEIRSLSSFAPCLSSIYPLLPCSYLILLSNIFLCDDSSAT